ncbi:MAG TPA: hypothetical protein VNK24_00445 [Elusimicrobiota bacterium]|nr:hypothetical protein [Elusimicrobiota bacterium]
MGTRKIAISLDIPICWNLIANGERIIEQAGPDSVDVEVREGSIDGESWLQALSRLLDEAEAELRRVGRRRRRAVADFDSRRSLNRRHQKTTVKRTGQ